MAIKTYKPTTPGRRGMTSQDNSEITSKKPVKSLLVPKKRGSGRNNSGRITVRHRGGGARQFYRLVNFNLPAGTTATIEAIEYDPNRSARIARIHYLDGEKSYILHPVGLKVGDTVKVQSIRAKDGSPNAASRGVTFSDGRQVFTASEQTPAPK